ncbi:MAG: hypothetical protein LIO75_03730 [Lachnospiraceae bacterium]|nr:hypothetical protein [Lachnospiraceae bacterium]
MRGTQKLYSALVNRVPGIRERYQIKRNHARGLRRGGVWLYLFGLNISYYVFRNRKLAHPARYPDYEKKSLYTEGSESSLSQRETPSELAEKLAEYDVISFDVFDTLILRPFSEPADLFFLMGAKLAYPDFKQIRQEMERRAREKKYKKERHYEVSLSEIYDILERETGLDRTAAMELEVTLEREYCFANPYMMEVVNSLRQTGKRLIITSDMYLNADQIRDLLTHCGFDAFDAVYVSCDHGRSKSRGDLFDLVRQAERFADPQARRMAHVGDNTVSDVEQAGRHGFYSVHYENVNKAGEPYRAEDMSVITGSLYRGTVNAHIHSGLRCFSREYEFGYICGGLFVTGYCRFIHDFVHRHSIDKLLFLARDGEILSKAYHILYPEEDGIWQYVYWSRLAAEKITAARFRYDYFRRFLYHKVNQGYSVTDIFASMELGDMAELCCRQAGLSPDAELTDRNADSLKKILLDQWEEILSRYAEQRAAGRLYYASVLEGCRSAAAVDIGWAGSGAITLDYAVNEIWQMNCPITGIVAGTNTCHNAEPDSSETFLQGGRQISYMYSQRENRDLWKFHDPGKGHNLYWELLLDAPAGSLKGFYLDAGGQCECRFKEYDESRTDKIREIHRGILGFAAQWKALSEKLAAYTETEHLSDISGRDAYAPMLIALGNKGYCGSFAELTDDPNL